MRNLDIVGMKKALWESENVRGKISKDYDFSLEARDYEHFSSLLIGALKQEVKAVDREVGNQEVFEAAVKALGSNSRPWSTFIAKENELRERLENYDPVQVAKKEPAALNEALKPYFPGQSRSNDIQAVIMWAKKLAAFDSFYSDVILKVANTLRDRYHETVKDEALTDEDLLICICGFFASPSQKLLREYGLDYNPTDVKFNGMGYVLASEFMRNLGWNGFKPDRHIKRLLAYWFESDAVINQQKRIRFGELLGSNNKDLREFIHFSLLGQQVSPRGMRFSEVDNLVWATGAYLIKKGKETEFPKFVVNHDLA